VIIGFISDTIAEPVRRMLADEFTYLPLDTEFSTIRLLRVLPGDRAAQLRCTIEHVPSTDASISYRALSYAWRDSYLELDGEDVEKENLIVNYTSSLLIGKNLAAFLYQIRHDTVPTDYMWIDAICINQEDIAERNMHVVKMGAVYRKAKNVIVWLGPTQDNSALAISFIEELGRLGRESSETTDDGTGSLFNFWNSSVKQKLQDASQDNDTKKNWVAIVDLFKRAWWRRTWIVQEVLLARDFTFMCGSSILDWTSLWQILENLWAHSHVSSLFTSTPTSKF
jgi:hypothetical protein